MQVLDWKTWGGEGGIGAFRCLSINVLEHGMWAMHFEKRSTTKRVPH